MSVEISRAERLKLIDDITYHIGRKNNEVVKELITKYDEISTPYLMDQSMLLKSTIKHKNYTILKYLMERNKKIPITVKKLRDFFEELAKDEYIDKEEQEIIREYYNEDDFISNILEKATDDIYEMQSKLLKMGRDLIGISNIMKETRQKK